MTFTSKVRLHPAFINFKRPSPHSKFSPSSAERWLLSGCSFSVNFCKDIPEETSQYAAEGTLAHSLCEALFRKEYYDIPVPNDMVVQLALLPDQGAEMWQAAAQYVEVVTYWLNNRDAFQVFHVRKCIYADGFNPGWDCYRGEVSLIKCANSNGYN
jgi:hypothetical protein